MNFRASTLALAGLAPLVLVLALTFGAMLGYAQTSPGDLGDWRVASAWSLLVMGGAATATVVGTWRSDADRAPGRLSLGYAAAAALGMIVFVYFLSYTG
ncbi:hypothetical protein [Demequina zhanjiangensis]|uniref:Uncharacterized protein n=1 Tax=Demequina zhanjiangensis TaxID=3051659 RepID=A0ABT8FYU6_9MICO|nr:hypothetical protein [Demequina sp. SYSU T00b26]MDN4472061.1 hypothetical protein [Demequina sp. SYSU T00b26]